jgi:acyl-CoA synthetase (AMP-forming)/AMP-acid ligase II
VSTTDPATTSRTMAEVLLARADQSPDELAFCFLIDGQEEGPRLTYADLDRQARSIAAALQDVAGPGDRALLVYAPGLAFVAAFFGCLYAGVVPVPTYPPRPTQGWQGLAKVAADCRPRVVLLDNRVAPFVPASGALPALAGVRHIVTDDLDTGRAWRTPAFDPDGLALLQYTSGTTAAPRGVMVTHRGLMHNQAMIRAAFEHAGPGGGVCWLPPYHDMGLIGGLLQTVYHGGWCRLMSPVALLQDPFRWLAAMSRYRADTSGGPNFAYDFCVQRVTPEQISTLDLSNWSVAAIGSEPVSAETMDRFAAVFEKCGFRSEAFCPCYGLAEATLLVTSQPKAGAPVVLPVSAATLEEGRTVPAGPGEATRQLVGCGRPWLGQEVRIVDPDACIALPDGHIGEVWVRGESVAAGYWDRPDETEQTFNARLADTGAGPYLRTGDLGFVRDGELFVTGRIKDVIIVRGRNHYPQDVEETVQAVHPGLRKGCGAAFEETRDGRPGVVVVQEVDRRCRGLDVRRLVADARQAVAERHEMQLHDLRLLEYGSIPKTSSGKVRRHACRLEYARGGLRPWKERGA